MVTEWGVSTTLGMWPLQAGHGRFGQGHVHYNRGMAALSSVCGHCGGRCGSAIGALGVCVHCRGAFGTWALRAAGILGSHRVMAQQRGAHFGPTQHPPTVARALRAGVQAPRLPLHEVLAAGCGAQGGCQELRRLHGRVLCGERELGAWVLRARETLRGTSLHTQTRADRDTCTHKHTHRHTKTGNTDKHTHMHTDMHTQKRHMDMHRDTETQHMVTRRDTETYAETHAQRHKQIYNIDTHMHTDTQRHRYVQTLRHINIYTHEHRDMQYTCVNGINRSHCTEPREASAD